MIVRLPPSSMHRAAPSDQEADESGEKNEKREARFDEFHDIVEEAVFLQICCRSGGLHATRVSLEE